MTRWQVATVGWCMIAAVAMAGDTCATRLEVVDRTGRIVWFAPIGNSESFDVSFIHSAERCRWIQHYRERHRSIAQTGSTFSCYGAGMPDGPIAKVTADGFFVEVARDLGRVEMRHAQDAGLRLIHRGTVHVLDAWFEDGDPFVLRVR